MAAVNPYAEVVESLEVGDYRRAVRLYDAADARPLVPGQLVDAIAITNVQRWMPRVRGILADERKAEVVDIAREWLDRILAHHFGDGLQQSSPALRRETFVVIQHVLGSDFLDGRVGVGPVGARSIALHDEWVVPEVVPRVFPVVPVTPATRAAGRLRVELAFAERCSRCRARAEPACRHTFDFAVTPAARPGGLLLGGSTATDRIGAVVVDRPAESAFPRGALGLMIARYRQAGEDLTIDQAERSVRSSTVVVVLMILAVGLLVGWGLGTPLVGVFCVLPTAVAPALAWCGVDSVLRRRTVARPFVLVGTPAAGVGGAWLLGTSLLAGALCGLVVLALIGVWTVLGTRLRRSLGIG